MRPRLYHGGQLQEEVHAPQTVANRTRLRPLIDVPRFPAYPSGHALQYFLVAKALSTVVHNDELSIELFKVARRIAENREWAGLHYASDTDAGEQLAITMFPEVTEAYRETFQNAAREWM